MQLAKGCFLMFFIAIVASVIIGGLHKLGLLGSEDDALGTIIYLVVFVIIMKLTKFKIDKK